MRIERYKITIIGGSKKPHDNNINNQLQWFGNALGLFGQRDKDRSMFRIFIELIKNAKTEYGLTSDEIANKLNLTRGTVIHHLNKLIAAGIVVHQKNRYQLRVDNLNSLIREIEKDLKRTCDDLKDVANDIDTWIGL